MKSRFKEGICISLSCCSLSLVTPFFLSSLLYCYVLLCYVSCVSSKCPLIYTHKTHTWSPVKYWANMPSTLSDFYKSHQAYRFSQNWISNEFWMTRNMLVFHFLNVSKCAFRRRFWKNPGQAREVTLIVHSQVAHEVKCRSNWSKMAKSRVKERAAMFTASEQESHLQTYEEFKHLITKKGNTAAN